MPCTTILVGRLATNDGSTMIARTDDGHIDVKKTIIVDPKKQPRKYTSKIGHLTIELPDNPMKYSASPSVDPKYGIWAATGINEKNVGMTATETTTSNPRVLAADPLVEYQKAKKKGEADIPGGIGEEDIVVLVLPYINSAREGVIRLGELLEKYGTYESNGIAFNDSNEIWWFETIGGHHYMARRVLDTEYVIMPNQFGLDRFDFDDAFGKQENNICSADMLDFIKNNNLNLNQGNEFNPRLVFGSDSDADHIYNTPRAWYMARYFNGHSYKFDGENALFNPRSNNIPWSFVPDRKITIEDVKYILSSYYQDTPYNPYIKADTSEKGIYRPIGISRTGVTSICQIRNNVPDEIKGIEWITYAANPFNVAIPIYTNVSKLPDYISKVELDCNTNNFYWQSRLIGLLADNHFSLCAIHIERYQNKCMTEARKLLIKYDNLFKETNDLSVLEKANKEICNTIKKITTKTLNKIIEVTSEKMINGYNRADK